MRIIISPSLHPHEIQTAIAPALEQLWKQKDERVKEFLDVQPHGVSVHNFVIQLAFTMVAYESFKICTAVSEGTQTFVDKCFANSISRRLLPVDGAHAASCEEMETTMSSVEAEQKATDYKSPDDGIVPDHCPTYACIRVVAYLSRVLEATITALEGLNKQAFLTELVTLAFTLNDCNTSFSRDTVPKPPIVKRVTSRRREARLQPASSRGGKGLRGGGRCSTTIGIGDMGGGNGDIGGGSGDMGGGSGDMSTCKGDNGCGISGGRGTRGGAKGTRGGGRGTKCGGKGSRGGDKGSRGGGKGSIGGGRGGAL
ncbi:exocyst complex component SEC10B-like protein [Tanacetum coccineum]